jgi:sulfatase maturation enzyme AslB (radical SAM superfamily)
MLGGEPLFVPKYYELLQRIIDSGRAPEVTIQFNTNMLAVQDKVFDLWKHFKQVGINMSCDGVNEVNEYVRWPGKWSKWERNLQKVINWQKQMAPGQFVLQVHSTMSSLTWLDLANLYEYTQTIDIWTKLPFLIAVNQPAYMDAVHLPDAIKQKGYDAACAVLNNSNAQDWEKAKNQSLLDHVMNTPRDPDKWEQFIDHTNRLDKVRNQTILDVIPEYKEYWHFT